MYLYIFEDESVGQVNRQPTADDLECVADGILQIIKVSEDGKTFQDLDPDGSLADIDQIK
jgi:hypothetical protein